MISTGFGCRWWLNNAFFDPVNIALHAIHKTSVNSEPSKIYLVARHSLISRKSSVHKQLPLHLHLHHSN
jgi:hypothetical protein